MRRARKTDLDAIVRMSNALAEAVDDPPTTLSVTTLGQCIFGSDRWSECFVAVRGADPLGYMLLSRYFEAHTAKRHLKIADLFVAPAARASGIGRLLFEAAVKRARSLHCAEISWEVWKENDPAYHFYERLGAGHNGDVTTMHFKL